MGENNIEVRGLCKTLGKFTLDHVSFSVPKGRIVGLIGENGAGKSTTINLILNEWKQDEGEIRIFGEQNTDYRLKDRIGVVFDECNFPESLNAKGVERILSGVFTAWDGAAYRRYLRQFDLPENKPIRMFSKGMKMKLSIACALAHHPRLLILDEATTGLDPVVRDEILDLFLEFIQDEERSVFFSSHITSDIEKVSDYVVFLHQGKVVLEEPRDTLLYQYGILRCREEDFGKIEREDYLLARRTHVCVECLVRDRERMARKYRDMVADRATLEEIMLFYVKGVSQCGG